MFLTFSNPYLFSCVTRANLADERLVGLVVEVVRQDSAAQFADLLDAHLVSRFVPRYDVFVLLVLHQSFLR